MKICWAAMDVSQVFLVVIVVAAVFMAVVSVVDGLLILVEAANGCDYEWPLVLVFKILGGWLWQPSNSLLTCALICCNTQHQ